MLSTQGLQGPFGDFLYAVGFLWNTHWSGWDERHVPLLAACCRRWAACWQAILRPPLQALLDFVDSLRHPLRLFRLYLLPAAAAVALAWLVRSVLTLPFALRVVVNGQTVGYVASEEIFDSARADVLARVNSARQQLAADQGTLTWDVEPGYTLAISETTMTESEIANEILRISGQRNHRRYCRLLGRSTALCDHRRGSFASLPACTATALG